MWLIDNKDNSHSHLIILHVSSEGSVYRYDKYKNINQEREQRYNSYKDVEELRDQCDELFKLSLKEKKRILEITNDTKNYHERISAKVIDNRLHIFYELYDVDIPVIGDYYLMDYVDGKYTLYISSKSRFMLYYLSKEDYYKFYNKISFHCQYYYSKIVLLYFLN